MASYEHLDLILGQVLAYITEVAIEIKELSLYNQKDLLKQLSRTMDGLWKVRDEIFNIKPEIRRDFINEYQDNKQRYENLKDIQKKAIEAMVNNDIESAIRHYRDLLEKSKYGYFKLIAEAGLYRLANQQNKDKI